MSAHNLFNSLQKFDLGDGKQGNFYSLPALEKAGIGGHFSEPVLAAGAEQELCSVFVGRTSDPVRIEPSEISAWRWISPESLQAELAGSEAGKFTPWFVMEWERIWRDHRAVLALKQ